MFSPLNDPQVEQWFQRLNAPLKRLPAEERTQIHQEVRQHLEALAAANKELGSSPEEAWEHALKQFGDPGKFGKRMAREWKLGKTGCRVEIVAIGFGFGLQVLSWLIYQPLFAIVFQRLVEIPRSWYYRHFDGSQYGYQPRRASSGQHCYWAQASRPSHKRSLLWRCFLELMLLDSADRGCLH